MVYLNLLTPAIGLTFWTSVVFIILLFLLTKFAWKPILKMVNEREEKIESALKSAEEAEKRMQALNAQNEELLKSARAERDVILKEARETREQVILEAKTKAKEEAERVMQSAREAIQNEKLAAIAELKNQVAILSIEVAERIIRQELASDDKQRQLANNLVEEVSI
jgi:F-type H+-transporting ATPase subunit b